ncbi:hypothetical protein BaRGS_00013172, partial [Batillaria attramentaria]
CKTGYYGSACESCPSNCDVTGCEWNTGDCNSCIPGYWGVKCDKSCPTDKCLNNTCNQDNGQCAGSAPARLVTTVQRVSPVLQTVTSRAVYGTLETVTPVGDRTGCYTGYWGDKCDKSCMSDNCRDNECYQHNGALCIPGKFGENCNQPCVSSDCEDGRCDRDNGQCPACDAGFWGDNCDKSCLPRRCAGNRCDQMTGSCPTSCDTNFLWPDCTECEDNYYGPACINQCGKCVKGTVCNSSDGTCPLGCVDGYQAPQCLEEQAPKPKPKPQIAVKPILHRLHNKGKENGDGGHVYMNLASVTTTDDGTQVSAEATGSTDHNRDRSTEASEITTPFATGGHGGSSASLASADQSMDDDGDYYNNTHVMFSSFRDTRPRLDEVQRHLVERLASTELVDKFHALDTNSGAPRDMASLPVNMKKNRFASILPYDANRVVLKDGYKKGGSTDYVNASYIQGYNSERMYIATQGPRDNTAVDFWRMVWQEHITHIVMLANVKELGKDKCFENWPGEKKKVTYGPITITSVDVEKRANFEVRTFSMKRTRSRDERTVVQYHYVTWPDHGAPSTTPLVSFWHYVRTRARDEPDAATVPTLVHCSAGVGRTGTFIGLDLGMDQAVREGEVDVEQIVIRLRQERCCMVQASEQFVFLSVYSTVWLFLQEQFVFLSVYSTVWLFLQEQFVFLSVYSTVWLFLQEQFVFLSVYSTVWLFLQEQFVFLSVYSTVWLFLQEQFVFLSVYSTVWLFLQEQFVFLSVYSTVWLFLQEQFVFLSVYSTVWLLLQEQFVFLSVYSTVWLFLQEQFVFLHKALLEAFTARDFIMAVDKFNDTFPQPVHAHTKNHKIDREFETMRDRKGCILTQLPLPNTLLDFWRMVWGQHADYIVSLATRDEERELTPYCWFWPRTSEDKILTGPYTVSLETTTQIGDHITHYTLKLEKESVTSSRDVHVLRYDDWVRELPGNTSAMIRLVDTLHDARTDDKGTHTIVQCRYSTDFVTRWCNNGFVNPESWQTREEDILHSLPHIPHIEQFRSDGTNQKMEHGALSVFAVLYVSWTVYLLTEENVAWGKPANTSSRYNSDTGYSGPACVANNGRLGTVIVNINYSEPNCIHTDNNDYMAWWEVYLGRPYTITGVTIYRREDSEWPQVVRRMSGIGVYVSGKLCYKFPPSSETLALDALPARIDVTCSQPITGDVVTLAKDGSDIDPAFYIINVCEVQVWVCKSGLYGENCAIHCSDKCRPGFDCDNFYGNCLEVCADGYYGDDCSRQCGRCKSSEPCNKSTGECSSGCETGYLPPFCEPTDGDGGQGTTTVTTTETLTTETATNLLAPLLGAFGALLAVVVIGLVGL